MKNQKFSLWPFQPADSLPYLKITGNISRSSNEFAIHYAIHGQLAELVIPRPTDTASRRNGLWEKTCFEFFLAVKNSPGYWEFNLSPAGHWNVYHFAAYRQEMQEEMAFTSLPFRVLKQADVLRLALELELDKIVQTGQILEVAISAVIKPKKGEVTYWALTHCGPQPDFHRRDSFILEV